MNNKLTFILLFTFILSISVYTVNAEIFDSNPLLYDLKKANKIHVEEWQIKGALSAFYNGNYEIKCIALEKLIELKAVNYVKFDVLQNILDSEPGENLTELAIKAISLHRKKNMETFKKLLYLYKHGKYGPSYSFVEAFVNFDSIIAAEPFFFLNYINNGTYYEKKTAVQILASVVTKNPATLMTLLEKYSTSISDQINLLKDMAKEVRYDDLPIVSVLFQNLSVSNIKTTKKILNILKHLTYPITMYDIQYLKKLLNSNNYSLVKLVGEYIVNNNLFHSDQFNSIITIEPDKQNVNVKHIISKIKKQLEIKQKQFLDTFYDKYKSYIDDNTRRPYFRGEVYFHNTAELFNESNVKYMDFFLECLESEKSKYRQFGMFMIRNLSHLIDDPYPLFVKMTTNKHEDVRNKVYLTLHESLGKCSKCVPYHLERLSSRNTDRSYEAYMLFNPETKISNDQISQIVIKLNSENYYEVISACNALSRLGKRCSFASKHIVSLLNNSNRDVVYAAIRALGVISQNPEKHMHLIAQFLHSEKMDLRKAAVRSLARFGSKAHLYADDISKLLSVDDSRAIIAAARALRSIGKLEFKHAKKLVNILKYAKNRKATYTLVGDPYPDAMKSLESAGPYNTKLILFLLDSAFENYNFYDDYMFLAIYLSGGSDFVNKIIKYIQQKDVRYVKNKLGPEEISEISQISEILVQCENNSYIKDVIGKNISELVTNDYFLKNNQRTAKYILTNFQKAKSKYSRVINSALITRKQNEFIKYIYLSILIHSIAWMLLLIIYPYSKSIQALFFWNPMVRNIAGFGYINLIINITPFIKKRLLKPFRNSMVSNHLINSYSASGYYDSVKVNDVQLDDTFNLGHFKDKMHKRSIVYGDSGTGKTYFLSMLLRENNLNLIYLPAWKCENGVINAIRQILHDFGGDDKFIKSFLHSNTMGVVIDGINEVAHETRLLISQFFDAYENCSAIIATQEIQWVEPAGFKKYKMLSLKQEQLKSFMLSRWEIVRDNATISETNYYRNVNDFIKGVEYNKKLRHNIRGKTENNPMDITVACELISFNIRPKQSKIIQQYYEKVNSEYERVNFDISFPLSEFAMHILDLKLADKHYLEDEKFKNEYIILNKFKMVVPLLNYGDKLIEKWVFRHDKIKDFFLAYAFSKMSINDLTNLSIDPSYVNTFLMFFELELTSNLNELKEKIIEYAALTKSHTVSDAIVEKYFAYPR